MRTMRAGEGREAARDAERFRRHGSGIRWGREEAGKRLRLGEPTRSLTPPAYRRPGYPLAGCSPAEPASVSPGEKAIPCGVRRGKINRALPVRRTGESVA
jgi:hypothetical protein